MIIIIAILVEAHARGHVLRQVAVVQVRHEAALHLLARVREALVAGVGVHARPMRH